MTNIIIIVILGTIISGIFTIACTYQCAFSESGADSESDGYQADVEV